MDKVNQWSDWSIFELMGDIFDLLSAAASRLESCGWFQGREEVFSKYGWMLLILAVSLFEVAAVALGKWFLAGANIYWLVGGINFLLVFLFSRTIKSRGKTLFLSTLVGITEAMILYFGKLFFSNAALTYLWIIILNCFLLFLSIMLMVISFLQALSKDEY